MRSLKSGLVAFVLAGLFGTAAVVGCSASGDAGGIGEDQNGTTPDDGTAQLPPPSTPPPVADAGKDANRADANKQETGVDAGPPPPTPGTACPTLNEKKSKACGMCGKAETLCLDDGSGKTGTWSDYGQCEGQTGVCEAGQTQACGNCGTQTCTNYCAWGGCTGQPANSCKAGSTESSTAGCTQANTYRNRTCSGTCTWGNFTATCEAPSMTVSATVGQTVSSNWALVATKTGKKLYSGECPGSLSTTADYPYFGVLVTNPTGQTATLQVFHSGVGSPLDTMIWVYDGSTYPTNDAQLQACTGKAADDCSGGTLADACGNLANGGFSFDWAGLDDVVIPPGGSILVYSAAYSPGEVGPFTLNVKTKSLD